MLHIKELCKIKGITQRELADKVDMPAPRISELIKGYSDPSLSRVVSIAKALGVTVSELIGEVTQDNCPPSSPLTCPHCGAKLKVNLEVEE